MSLTYIGILLGILANSIGLILTLLKVSTKISTQNAVQTERIKTLENQVNNDITGRKVVSEMRQDLAVIKTEIGHIKTDLQHITKQKI
jgi:predicted  nucleic acid-binding Zn-ribbon protein